MRSFLRLAKATKITKEIHERLYGNHLGGRSLAYKALTARYYWPYMTTEENNYNKKCDRYQRFAPQIHQPA